MTDLVAQLVGALQDCLDRIEKSEFWWMDCPDRGGFDADAIRAALSAAKDGGWVAEPVGEPVAWRYKIPTHGGGTAWTHMRTQPECLIEAQPLYTHPAPGVPEGWRITDDGDGSITIKGPGKISCNVSDEEPYGARIFGDVLHALCSALLAAQAKGAGHE